ncbi:methyl-accepting chemotaxis protein [Clostridium chromiireducens]|uniref:Methyl-accepting chemotaxis protein McpB n=1 Tax=Clostridium chromiireducens TaxID=225345 RepID=A0A1V4IK15_9CLOT|nr:methyl-accepting chemotaxis protein [Clostridium chromiireducens]OPJ60368.1 methyl-accepting chemotaxis protein McpB [Clostridium chromiireducens]
MIKIFKVNHKKTAKNIRDKKKRNILYEFERIIRSSKIKTRLMISYGLLVLIPLLIVGVTSVLQSKNSIDNKISNFSSQVMSQIGLNILSEMDKNSNFAMSIVTEPDFQDYFENKQEIDLSEGYRRINDLTNLMKSKAGTKNDMTGLGIIGTDNEKIGSFSNQLSDDIRRNLSDLSNEGKGKFVWSLNKNASGYKIYASAQINTLTTGENFGIIIEELNPKLFVNLFKNVSLGTNSDIFVVDSKGIVILNEDSSLIGTEYKDKSIIEKIKDKEKDLFNIDDETKQTKQYFSTNDGESLVSYAPLSGSDWYVVGVIPYSYLNLESNILRNNTIIIGLVSFIISMLVALIVSRSISNPLGKLVSLMKKAKNGNLALLITDDSKDEIGEVINAFNDMVIKISTLISGVKILANNVSNNTKTIAEVSERSCSSSEEIAATMSEIAQGASNQAISANEGMECMNILSNGINKVSRKTENVWDVLEETQKLKKEAVVSVKILKNKAEETSKVSAKIVGDVNSLNLNVKDIKEIVELIGDIAERTNLLALNAAIEAARAGDAGKGFAIVADEVRKLADKSKESSVQINKIINDIENKVEVMVREAGNSTTIIKEQMNAVENTDEAFKIIFEGMNQISYQLKDIVGSINEIVDSKDKTKIAMESISAISEETAAATEQVSAGANEQIEEIQKVSQFAEELNVVVEKLNSTIDQFVVN